MEQLLPRISKPELFKSDFFGKEENRCACQTAARNVIYPMHQLRTLNWLDRQMPSPILYPVVRTNIISVSPLPIFLPCKIFTAAPLVLSDVATGNCLTLQRVKSDKNNSSKARHNYPSAVRVKGPID